MTARATLAQFYDPDTMHTAAGKPDWEQMVAQAQRDSGEVRQ